MSSVASKEDTPPAPPRRQPIFKIENRAAEDRNVVAVHAVACEHGPSGFQIREIPIAIFGKKSPFEPMPPFAQRSEIMRTPWVGDDRRRPEVDGSVIGDVDDESWLVEAEILPCNPDCLTNQAASAVGRQKILGAHLCLAAVRSSAGPNSHLVNVLLESDEIGVEQNGDVATAQMKRAEQSGLEHGLIEA